MSVEASGIVGNYRGVARNGQESNYPNLWQGLVAAYAPQIMRGSTSTFANSTIYDVSSHRHHSRVNTSGNKPTYIIGKTGRELNYSPAGSQNLEIPNQNDFNIASRFTIVQVITFTSFPANRRGIVTKVDGASTTFELSAELNSGNNGQIEVRGDGGTQLSSGGSTVTIDTKYILVATYDGTTTKIYINGKFFASTTSITYSNNSTNVLIGQETNRIDAKMGTTLIYNRALVSSEVKQLNNAINDMFLVPSRLRRSLLKPFTTTTQTIDSDANILATTTRTILSDTRIFGTTTQVILSDATVVNTTTQTILSDANIFATTTRTILSDARIFGTTTQTILSDTEILVVTQQTILSDARIFGTTTQTIQSSSDISVIREATFTSNAIIFEPFDLEARILFTNDRITDRFIEIEILQATLSIPASVTIANTGTGDSVRIEWTGTGPYYNVYRVDTGPVYVKMNSFPILDTFYVVGGLVPGTTYTFVVRSFDGVI